MTVTVLSGPERRRRWSAAEKLRMVEESLSAGAIVAEVARRHDVHPNLLHLWRREGSLSGAGDSGARFRRQVLSPARLRLLTAQGFSTVC